MRKPASRAFFLCVITAIALVSGSDATLAGPRNDDIASSSSMALDGICCISQFAGVVICVTLFNHDDDDGD